MSSTWQVAEQASPSLSALTRPAGSTLESRWIVTLDAFQAVAAAWDAALIQSGSWNPFLLSDFILSWWLQYHEGRQLRILACYDDGALIGGLPLYLARGGPRQAYARVLSHIGDGAANYTEPLWGVSCQGFRGLLEHGLARRNDWDVLHLPNVQGNSPLIAEYGDRRVPAGPFRSYLLQDHANWAIDVSMGKGQYTASLSKKMRRDLRAKRKHAEQRYGPMQLRSMTAEADILAAFERYCRFSRDAFEHRRRQSTFEDPRYTGFFRTFLLRMARAQRLDAHVLVAGDTPLAVSFGYRFGPGFNWVLTAFNYECKYVRPGYLLIEELVEETLRRGESRYNWYGYDRFYKGQWCNEQTPLYQFLLINDTVRGRSFRAVRRLETALRSNAAVMRAVQRVNRWLGRGE